jgi:hypothetical protein
MIAGTANDTGMYMHRTSPSNTSLFTLLADRILSGSIHESQSIPGCKQAKRPTLNSRAAYCSDEHFELRKTKKRERYHLREPISLSLEFSFLRSIQLNRASYLPIHPHSYAVGTRTSTRQPHIPSKVHHSHGQFSSSPHGHGHHH